MKFELKEIYLINFKSHFLIAKTFVENEFILTEFANLINFKSNIEKIIVDFILKI